MSQVDPDKLFELFHQKESHRTAHEKVALSNLFALGCYLHLNGQTKAGRKACRNALNAIGTHNRNTFMNKIMDTLAGNEAVYASKSNPNTEISALFRSTQCRSESDPE